MSFSHAAGVSIDASAPAAPTEIAKVKFQYEAGNDVDLLRVPITAHTTVKMLAHEAMKRLSRRRRCTDREIAINDIHVDGAALYSADTVTSVVDIKTETITLTLAVPMAETRKNMFVMVQQPSVNESTVVVPQPPVAAAPAPAPAPPAAALGNSARRRANPVPTVFVAPIQRQDSLSADIGPSPGTERRATLAPTQCSELVAREHQKDQEEKEKESKRIQAAVVKGKNELGRGHAASSFYADNYTSDPDAAVRAKHKAARLAKEKEKENKHPLDKRGGAKQRVETSETVPNKIKTSATRPTVAAVGQSVHDKKVPLEVAGVDRRLDFGGASPLQDAVLPPQEVVPAGPLVTPKKGEMGWGAVAAEKFPDNYLGNPDKMSAAERAKILGNCPSGVRTRSAHQRQQL